MSNILNMSVVSAAIDAGVANSTLGGKEALCAATMNDAYAKAGVVDMPEAERVAWLEGNLANLITGLFLGRCHAAKDKTFKRDASAGVLAQVQRMALLQAAGQTASQKDKKAAREGLNEAQLKIWADLRGQTSRILKASNVPHPHPRAPRASTENETTEPTPAPASAKIEARPENLKAPAKPDAAWIVEMMGFVLQRSKGEIAKGDAAGRELHAQLNGVLNIYLAATKAE